MRQADESAVSLAWLRPERLARDHVSGSRRARRDAWFMRRRGRARARGTKETTLTARSSPRVIELDLHVDFHEDGVPAGSQRVRSSGTSIDRSTDTAKSSSPRRLTPLGDSVVTVGVRSLMASAGAPAARATAASTNYCWLCANSVRYVWQIQVLLDRHTRQRATRGARVRFPRRPARRRSPGLTKRHKWRMRRVALDPLIDSDRAGRASARRDGIPGHTI